MTRRFFMKVGAVFVVGWLSLALLPVLADSQSAPSSTKMVCGHAHAPPGSETTIAGQRVHRKTNPRGDTYVFGTYTAAQQVRVVTKPTTSHTWFEGYGWSVLVCASSNQHVGWRFSGGGGTFYALLIDVPVGPGV